MGKNIKVLGLAVHPISEKQISFLTSDGRIYILDYKEKKEDTVKTFAVPIEGQGAILLYYYDYIWYHYHLPSHN